MADAVKITSASRYIQVVRADGSVVSRNLTVEDAIEAAVNAGSGDYRITYPDRIVKVYGTIPASPAPGVPTDLAVEEYTAGYVSLSWTDDGSGTSWTVYRDGVPIGNVSSTSYTDYAVVPSAGYSYQVQAYNSSGSSVLSAALAVTTSVNSLPAWSLTDQSGTIGVAFALNLNTGCEDSDLHALAYALVSGSVPGLSLASPNYTGTPTTAGAFALTFRANDGYGTSDVSITFNVYDPDVTAPAAPTGVSASVNGSTVTVTWTGSTDASGVSGYKVYRDGQYRAPAAASPYVESGVPVGSYSYTVSAVDSSANANESAQSSAAPVTVVPASPDTPINFTATSDGATTINLSWAPGPNGATPDDYDLDFSATSASGPWTAITFVGTATTYAHTGRTAGVTYYYQVKAKLGVSESGYAAATASASSFVWPWPVQSGGPSWPHGTLALYAGDGTNDGALTTWKTWIGHQPDIMGVYINCSTWTAFRTGLGNDTAYLYPVIASVPSTTPIILSLSMYPSAQPTVATGGYLNGPLERSGGNRSLPSTGGLDGGPWGTQMWNNFIGGFYDDHYRTMAQGLKNLCAGSHGIGSDGLHRSAADFILRLGWEMNGDWYAWSIGNNVAKFKQAWERVVGIVREEIPGIWFDFSPSSVPVRGTSPAVYISGYTPNPNSWNVLSVSHHDAATISGQSSSTVTRSTPSTWTPHETYLNLFWTHAVASGKKMALTEWAAQMANCDATYHVASQDPEWFYIKTWEWLEAHAADIAWDTHFSPGCCSLVSRQTTPAALYFKSQWGS